MFIITKLQPVIKWTGSKRSQAEAIIERFPKEINTYYEPFIGGGSVMFRLLHSDIKVNKIICSDINNDLINLWNEIKNNPDVLIKSYNEMWQDLNSTDDIDKKKEYFYKIRERFNINRSPIDFLFLSRTCVNGLIRYNQKGNFNTGLHFTRKGIDPKRLEKILLDWSNKLNINNVEFLHRSYIEIETDENDLLYLDPPYANTKGIYYGVIDYEEMWNWLRNQRGGYLLSFDGKRDELDNTYSVPKDIYSEHVYLKSGRSSFKDIVSQKTEYVQESLYIKNT